MTEKSKWTEENEKKMAGLRVKHQSLYYEMILVEREMEFRLSRIRSLTGPDYCTCEIDTCNMWWKFTGTGNPICHCLVCGKPIREDFVWSKLIDSYTSRRYAEAAFSNVTMKDIAAEMAGSVRGEGQ